MRPFEVVLLEIVPHGRSPSLDRGFASAPLSRGFAEPSRTLNVDVTESKRTVDSAAAVAWTVLDPTEATSADGATLTELDDHSVLASGKAPMTDTYTVTANTNLPGIVAFRLEARPDPSLPCSGPGRASNGNLMLSEIHLNAWPRGNLAAATTVAIDKASADFSPPDYPVGNAIDGNPRTFWTVDPFEGRSHTAIFQTKQPIDFADATLQFTIEQGQHETASPHTLGHFRLSVATTRPPIGPKEPRTLIVKTQTPASRNGGVIVVDVKIASHATPLQFISLGKTFVISGTLAGQSIAWQPVLGSEVAASWQAWRTVVGSSLTPHPLEFKIETSLPHEADLDCECHFLPK